MPWISGGATPLVSSWKPLQPPAPMAGSGLVWGAQRCLILSQKAFMSGEHRRLRGSLGLPYVCLCVWEVLRSFPGFKKSILDNAILSGVRQILETLFTCVRWLLRSFTQRDFRTPEPFTLRGQSLWIRFPRAKHWRKLCLPVSSHTFDFFYSGSGIMLKKAQT